MPLFLLMFLIKRSCETRLATRFTIQIMCTFCTIVGNISHWLNQWRSFYIMEIQFRLLPGNPKQSQSNNKLSLGIFCWEILWTPRIDLFTVQHSLMPKLVLFATIPDQLPHGAHATHSTRQGRQPKTPSTRSRRKARIREGGRGKSIIVWKSFNYSSWSSLCFWLPWSIQKRRTQIGQPTM